MRTYHNKIAITTGDCNGIGAEITIKALNALDIPVEDAVIITDPRVLNHYGKLEKNYEILPVEYVGLIETGEITADAGEFAYKLLEKACKIKPKAIVTAPTSKEAMYLAGRKFNGQTEVLEKLLANSGEKAEMLFISPNFDVFLLTRHCPLNQISITTEMLIEKIVNLAKFYQHPTKFALCGLNPHAGEDGILGEEEIKIIIPAVNRLQEMGISITMPKPADTLFIEAVQAGFKNQKAPYDCYIAMYHDQGLIPIKSVAMDTAVNTTIGLPILRTSPSHGTAFDIAGKGIANPTSMISAIKTAYEISNKKLIKQSL